VPTFHFGYWAELLGRGAGRALGPFPASWEVWGSIVNKWIFWVFAAVIVSTVMGGGKNHSFRVNCEIIVKKLCLIMHEWHNFQVLNSLHLHYTCQKHRGKTILSALPWKILAIVSPWPLWSWWLWLQVVHGKKDVKRGTFVHVISVLVDTVAVNTMCGWLCSVNSLCYFMWVCALVLS